MVEHVRRKFGMVEQHGRRALSLRRWSCYQGRRGRRYRSRRSIKTQMTRPRTEEHANSAIKNIRDLGMPIGGSRGSLPLPSRQPGGGPGGFMMRPQGYVNRFVVI